MTWSLRLTINCPAPLLSDRARESIDTYSGRSLQLGCDPVEHDTLRFRECRPHCHLQCAGSELVQVARGRFRGARHASAAGRSCGRYSTCPPDVLLLNEIDDTGPEDSNGEPPVNRDALGEFLSRDLAYSQHGSEPIADPHRFYCPSNTGVPSGIDLNQDGKPGGPSDAFGFGRIPVNTGWRSLHFDYRARAIGMPPCSCLGKPCSCSVRIRHQRFPMSLRMRMVVAITMNCDSGVNT